MRRKRWRRCISKKVAKKAEGRARLLHKITKPTAWRGGAPILKKEEDVSCEEIRKDGTKHWQCNEEVQNGEDTSWKIEDLTKLEEALPRLKECELEKVSRLYEAQTGVGCDGFNPKVPLDLTKETRGNS